MDGENLEIIYCPICLADGHSKKVEMVSTWVSELNDGKVENTVFYRCTKCLFEETHNTKY